MSGFEGKVGRVGAEEERPSLTRGQHNVCFLSLHVLLRAGAEVTLLDFLLEMHAGSVDRKHKKGRTDKKCTGVHFRLIF